VCVKPAFLDGRCITVERRNWGDNHLIAPNALRDFQKLSDEAFLSLRRKYFSPADLVAKMRLRRILESEAAAQGAQAQAD
jgi:hypothetical protein